MSEAEVVRVNVSVLPDAVSRLEVSRLAASLPPGKLVDVAAAQRLPHMTLYMSYFRRSSLPLVLARCESVTSDLEPLQGLATGVCATKGGYVELSCLMGRHYQKMQRLYVDALAELRDQVRAAKSDHPGFADRDEKLNLVRHGYDLLFSSARPHITLARYEEKSMPSRLPDVVTFPVVFDFLCVGLADEHGAVTGSLATFRLEDGVGR